MNPSSDSPCIFLPLSKRGWLGALLAALLLLVGTRPASAVEIEALVGFGQGGNARSFYRMDCWTPLTVYLTGQGIQGNGQLQVTVENDGRTTIYTRSVSLREGSLKEAHTESFVFFYRAPQWTGMGMGTGKTEIHVQLRVEGRQVAQKSYTVQGAMQVNPDAYNVLALNRDGSGLNFLSKKLMGLVHRHVNPESSLMQRSGAVAGPNGINPAATLNVLYSRQDALPAMAQGYGLVDAIALADLPLDNLTESQLAAIKGYVREGGLLVLSGGGDMARLRSQFFKELLPLEPTGTTPVQDLPELASRYRQSLRFPIPIALTAGTLKPGAFPLFNPAGRSTPLISARPYGNGMVVFTTFDYLDPTIRGWKEASSLWRDLLRCGNESISPRNILAGDAGALQSGTLALADALAGKQASSIPPFSVIALFIGSYLVLLIPVSYLILKRLDRRELAWFTAPVLILGFTVISYLIARTIKGGALTVNRAVLLETGANSEQVAGYARFSVYSPRRSAYDIALYGSNPSEGVYRDVAPIEITDSVQNLNSELKVDHDATTTLRQTQINLWDKRSFDTPVVTSLGGAVEARTRMLNTTQAEVTVTNKTRYALKDCVLIAHTLSVKLGDLAPGQTRKETISWTYKENVSTLSFPNLDNVNRDPNLPDTPEIVHTKIRQSLTQALTTDSSNGYSNYGRDEPTNYGRAPNALIGWFYDPLLNVTVDGKPTQGEEVNLLFVHLPAPANAPEAIRKAFNPFADLPILNLEDVQKNGVSPGRDIFRGKM